MTNDWFLRKRLCLGSILVSGRFVSKRFNKFISEDLDVCSFVALEGICSLLNIFPGAHRYIHSGIEGLIVFFRDDDGRVGISSEDSFVPHEVIVDKFAE